MRPHFSHRQEIPFGSGNLPIQLVVHVAIRCEARSQVFHMTSGRQWVATWTKNNVICLYWKDLKLLEMQFHSIPLSSTVNCVQIFINIDKDTPTMSVSSA